MKCFELVSLSLSLNLYILSKLERINETVIEWPARARFRTFLVSEPERGECFGMLKHAHYNILYGTVYLVLYSVVTTIYRKKQ